MLILGVDTSSGSAVALVRSAGSARPGAPSGADAPLLGPLTVLGRAGSDHPRKHAELLTPLIAGLLDDAGDGDVGLVAVGTGPAPFTGLRAGLVTARVFARGRGVPVHGVCALDVLARQAFDALGADGEAGAGEDAAEVLVVTDARRREVYWARYRAHGPDDVQLLDGPGVATPAAVAGQRVTWRVGEGTLRYPDLLPADPAPQTPGPDAPGVPTAVDPAVLARVVLSRLARHERGEPLEDLGLGLEPRYLRRPDAQAPGRAGPSGGPA